MTYHPRPRPRRPSPEISARRKGLYRRRPGKILGDPQDGEREAVLFCLQL